MGAAERGKGMNILGLAAVVFSLMATAAVAIGVGVHMTTRYE